MPTWISVTLGIAGGAAAIAGAIYLAIRPYLRADLKPWLPDAREGNSTPNDYASPGYDGHGGFDGGGGHG